MMTFPLDGGASFVVIEPGNIQRLKSGKPLRVGEVLIAFTPDMEFFAQQLGVKGSLPNKGERIECQIHLTPEQIDAALKAAHGRKEVMR